MNSPITFYFPTWGGFKICSSRLLMVSSGSLRTSILLVFPIFVFLLQFYIGYFSLKNQLHEHINPFIWKNIFCVFCLGRKTQFLILPLCFSPFHSTYSQHMSNSCFPKCQTYFAKESALEWSSILVCLGLSCFSVECPAFPVLLTQSCTTQYDRYFVAV